MSRVGKKPVVLPAGVKAEFKNGMLTVTGPKGSLNVEIPSKVMVTVAEQEIVASVEHQENKKEKALWGLSRALIQNMVDGVTKAFSKELDVVGVGFKAEHKGQSIILNLGFSHPIEFPVPKGIEVKIEKQPVKVAIQQYQTTITLSGSDKQLLGQTAANLRKLKEPEPYKGKGIKYADEVIIRKAGKVVKAVGK